VLDESDSTPTTPTTKVADLPFGITPDTPYREYTTRLARGDMLLCYTDAFSEARGADGALLGIDGLLSAVSSIPVSSGEAVVAEVVSSVRAVTPGNLDQDDATLMLFRANRTPSSLRDTLMSPFRLLGTVADSSKIRKPTTNARGGRVAAIAD
jgi:serine phosphatase RsbU (regulator of sigma subunit)